MIDELSIDRTIVPVVVSLIVLQVLDVWFHKVLLHQRHRIQLTC